MKFSEGPQEESRVTPNEILVKATGGTEKMSEPEKLNYLLERKEDVFQCMDFIRLNEYKDIFKQIDLNNKRMAFVGAGFSIGKECVPGPLFSSLMILNPSLEFIPIDSSRDRLKSWHVIESKHSNIRINAVASDGLKLPLPDASVDVYGSVNLINDPTSNTDQAVFVKNLVSEGYRVLKPGGSMILSSFGYNLYLPETGAPYFNNEIKKDEMLSPAQILSYLELVGFKDIRKIPLDQELISKYEIKRGEIMSIEKWVKTKMTNIGPCGFLAIK